MQLVTLYSWSLVRKLRGAMRRHFDGGNSYIFRNYCKYNKPETCGACVSVELQYSNYVRRVSIYIYIYIKTITSLKNMKKKKKYNKAFVEVISKLSL